jgi:hypothetical protein
MIYLLLKGHGRVELCYGSFGVKPSDDLTVYFFSDLVEVAAFLKTKTSWDELYTTYDGRGDRAIRMRRVQDLIDAISPSTES